jgi:hypothetical protein
MTPRDFPCFACGFEGPHRRVQAPRPPTMTDAQWAQASQVPPLVICGACQERIWEPDTGDGLADPDLTMIPPGLRDLAHQALEARDLPQFLILADGHHRGQLVYDNELFFRRLAMWDDVFLAHLRLISPD